LTPSDHIRRIGFDLFKIAQIDEGKPKPMDADNLSGFIPDAENDLSPAPSAWAFPHQSGQF